MIIKKNNIFSECLNKIIENNLEGFKEFFYIFTNNNYKKEHLLNHFLDYAIILNRKNIVDFILSVKNEEQREYFLSNFLNTEGLDEIRLNNFIVYYNDKEIENFIKKYDNFIKEAVEEGEELNENFFNSFEQFKSIILNKKLKEELKEIIEEKTEKKKRRM